MNSYGYYNGTSVCHPKLSIITEKISKWLFPILEMLIGQH